jgi:hypothetical protein
VETDKQTVFEGEPVIATYKLYSRLNVNSRVTKQPSFSGATAVDLMDANAQAQTVESYGGKKYAVYLIRKLALYPLHAGDLVLEAAETENEIHFTRVRDMAEAQAGGGRDEQYMHVLKSKPVTLKVKALPEAKKPAGFGGAVGSGYSIEAVTNTNNIPAGEIMKLMVLVKGSGNMQMLTAPMVPWGEDAESFETKSKEDMDVSTVPLTGRKAFEYSFSINKEGSYTIPPIKLDYFDTKSNSYKSIASQPILINVSKGTGKKPVRPNAGEANKNETASANWLWWVVGGVVLLLTGLLWIFASRRNKRQAVEDTPTLASLTTATVPETANAETATYEEKVPYEKPDPLKQSRDLLYSQNSKAFYQQLQKDLWPVLQTKFGLPPHDTNKQNLAFAMQNAATNQAMQANILQLLSNMETALYAPFSSADSLFNDFMQAEGIVKNL